MTGTGKRQYKSFDTKAKAEEKIRSIRQRGPDSPEIQSDDFALLALIKKQFGGNAAEVIRNLDFAKNWQYSRGKTRRSGNRLRSLRRSPGARTEIGVPFILIGKPCDTFVNSPAEAPRSWSLPKQRSTTTSTP